MLSCLTDVMLRLLCAALYGKELEDLALHRRHPVKPIVTVVIELFEGGYGYYEQGGYGDVPYDYSTYKQGYQAAGYDSGSQDPYTRPSYDSYDYNATTGTGASYGYDAYYQASGDYRGSYANGAGAQYTAAARAPPPPPPPPGGRGGSYGSAAYPGRY